MPFKPGESGNKRGRPTRAAINEKFGPYEKQSIETLVALLSGEDDKLRYKAATYIIDRLYGRAPQAVTVEGDAAAALPRIVEALLPKPSDPTG